MTRMKNMNMPSVKVNYIKFKSGTSFNLNDDDIVLLVGANNVGKSRVLKDLKIDLSKLPDGKVLIENVEYTTSNFSYQEVKEYLDQNLKKDKLGNYNITLDDSNSYSFHVSTLEDYLKENKKELYKVFYTFLSTETRLGITKPIRFDSQVNQGNLRIMSQLEKKLECITKLNNFLKLAFNYGIEIYGATTDFNYEKKYKISESNVIEKIINLPKRDAFLKLEKLNDLQDQGDGVRSAIAILASLIVNDHSLFLIDEPETFLHPPQARLLGKNLAEIAQHKQCFISTHDIDFIKGVLESNAKRVKIIKIDRTGSRNEFNIVDNESIVKIANDKNLKYTNILDGLFYNQVVLCENESDCRFYSAILEYLNMKTYQETLFCAVGGKDQFKKVIPLLIKLNIPYKVIADIDLINDVDKLKQLIFSIDESIYNLIEQHHKDFLKLFNQEQLSQVKTQKEIKNEIMQIFNDEKYLSPEDAKRIKTILKDSSKLALLKQCGESAIPPGECFQLYNEIKNFLNSKNIFILECGEIESLVPTIGGSHGAAWVERALTTYTDMSDDVFKKSRDFITEVFNL